MGDAPMFDEDSFTIEITTAEEAKACVDYFARNERNFRKELIARGLSHEEEDARVRDVCTNLVKSCRRVGYRSSWVDEKAERYGL